MGLPALSASSTTVQVALWVIIAVAIATIALFVYTVSLRVALIRTSGRRRDLLRRWRPVIALATIDRRAAGEAPLPDLDRRDHIELLNIWNRARLSVVGRAADNLNIVARRAGLDQIAGEAFYSNDRHARLLAIQTLGHLQYREYREPIESAINSDDPVLSITAALALVEIDPNAAVNRVVPLIARRRDWPRSQVSQFLRLAGRERIAEPMYRALRTADADDTIYLLQFGGLVEAEVLDALAVELVRESTHPGIIVAALKHVSGLHGVPRLAALTRHREWFVRMQAAKVIGRLGAQEHVALLEALLEDPEWWVRYRAAQSLVSLPFLGPNRLRLIRRQQKDRFAGEILEQAFAEVGLA